MKSNRFFFLPLCPNIIQQKFYYKQAQCTTKNLRGYVLKTRCFSTSNRTEQNIEFGKIGIQRDNGISDFFFTSPLTPLQKRGGQGLEPIKKRKKAHAPNSPLLWRGAGGEVK